MINKFINFNSHKNQNGQALLFVVVAMTVALAVGVNVSLRTLSSVSRVSTSDTASRVLAAAEGGLERFLVKPISEIEDLAAECTNYENALEDSDCTVRFDAVTNDNIRAQAIVTIEPHYVQNDVYSYSGVAHEIREVNIEGYSDRCIYLCWDNNSTALYYSMYGNNASNPENLWGIACPRSGCPSGVGGTRANSSVGTCSGFSSVALLCGIDAIGSVQGFRIMPLHENTNIRIAGFTSNAWGALQGYNLTATGELLDVGASTSVKATQDVTVFRSLPYLPAAFDFGLYAEGIIE